MESADVVPKSVPALICVSSYLQESRLFEKSATRSVSYKTCLQPGVTLGPFKALTSEFPVELGFS